ncbi:thiamine-phosphate kinase [Amycolatopsis sp. NPDC059027]|uniref:thiamine-phosphate kinase n=1 Tax=Amycolatopsis sp. NPDC059027 TaxID=3346709 RepID=UPI00366A8C7B
MSGEKDRVRWIADHLMSVNRTRSDGELAELGIGYVAGVSELDDCSVVSTREAVDLVFGADYVRGPKFHLYEAGYLTNSDIGRFCVTANASDIAAMGALGVGFFSIVRYPPEFSDRDFCEVMTGMDEACQQYGLRLLGGDTGSAERLILSGFAVGVNRPGKNLLRSRARPGDVVAVTGRVGGAGAAVMASSSELVAQLEARVWEELLTSWTGFNAQMEVGRALAELDIRMSCQDVSDGLRATAAELARSSGVGIVLDLERIPLGVGVAEVANLVGRRPEELAISASTDFCLCFSCPEEAFGSVAKAIEKIGAKCYPVGECVEGEGVRTVNEEGALVQAPGVEWNHQSEDINVVKSMILKGISLSAKPSENE